MTPAESIDYLLSLQPSGIKLGLDNMRRLCAALGHPERTLPVVHIAGTNGKGSVAAMLESVLRASGLRTGLYTSPHLVDFGERIRIDGRPLAPEELATRVGDLRGVLDSLRGEGVRATFFEATTALAFCVFRDHRPDLVVLETGLGGRLDSTNVVDPVCTAITSIGLDHMDLLGPTRAHIAAEKAGILKPGRPTVLGRMPGEARSVIQEKAGEVGCVVLEAGDGLPASWDPARRLQALTWRGRLFHTALPGSHQAANAAVVLELVECLRAVDWVIPESAVRAGLESVVWPARFEILSHDPPWVLDGGHNEDGLRGAMNVWQSCFGGLPGRVVFGCMRDKDTTALVRCLDHPDIEVHLVPVGSPRSADPADLARAFTRARPQVWPGLSAARAELLAHPHPDGTLIIGSLYLAGEWKSLAESRGHQLGLNG